MVDRLKQIGVKRMQYLQTLARQDQEFNLLGVPAEQIRVQIKAQNYMGEDS